MPKINRPTSDSDRVKDRPKRVPISGARDVLTVDETLKDSDYHYCWFNDEENNIHRAQSAWYEFVDGSGAQVGETTVDTTSSRIPTAALNKLVGTKKDGSPLFAYLMRIRKEYHEEDKSKAQRVIDEREQDMKRSLSSREDGRYGNASIGRN